AFSYDALDRLHEEIGFDGRLTRYRYDAAGLPMVREEHGSPTGKGMHRHPDARIDTHYQRDAAGRLVEKLVSRITGPAMAEQLRTQYRYDKLGRLVQARNAQAEVELQYDALGQLISETTTGRHHASRIAHAYDVLGNRIQTVLPDGRKLNQLFYGSGHLHQVNLDGEVICDIERDALHREVGRTQGPLNSLFQYDKLGRLTGQQVSGSLAEQRRAWQALDKPELDSSLIARRYDYDKSGELIAIEDARLGRTAYHYDALGGILSAVHPTTQERFAFDPAHNLIDDSLQAQGGRIENNRVTVFEDKRYAYDVHGELIAKKIGRHTEMTLQWNGEHQLIKAVTTRQAHTDQQTVQTVMYGYDPFGRRLYKKDAFGITHFVWDGNRLLEEVRGNHARTYVHQPGSFVPLAQVNRVCKQDREASQSAKKAEVLHIHTDHLGTPREMTDERGQLQWAATYRTWGNVLRVEEPEADDWMDERAQRRVFEEAQSLRFQGQYYDAETGLHYNRFRYYDPDCGRFVSQDPVGLQGGNNFYQYAPNPVVWIDPLRLTSTTPPTITAPEITGKTRTEICDLAKQKGLIPKKNDATGAPIKWHCPCTGKERLRLDRGHIDAKTGLPYNDPKAAVDHVHGYDPTGKVKIVSPNDGNPHFPTKGE
ncbi:RHS repeat-associated core domain-containing protein, partial [Noviherbaspirillum sp. CPCC 100848]